MSETPPPPSDRVLSPDNPGATEGAPEPPEEPERRDFLSKASSVAMAAGLAAAYGGLGLIGVRYLYPASKKRTAWMYVVDLASFKKGASTPFRTPSGEKVMIARVGDGDDPSAFVALSSTCPHLGCQVHWEGGQNRFFCPCHNGTFDATGIATGGPPKEAGQSLPRYPLKIERGLLYIEVAVETLPAEGRHG
ncbi:MAG: Rieske (2Fe-2S) protein [Polyangiaceae bacterium]